MRAQFEEEEEWKLRQKFALSAAAAADDGRMELINSRGFYWGPTRPQHA